MRKRTDHSVDQKVFRQTAAKSKKMNVNPRIFRGGIRL